jgi:hypothetical protein
MARFICLHFLLFFFILCYWFAVESNPSDFDQKIENILEHQIEDDEIDSYFQDDEGPEPLSIGTAFVDPTFSLSSFEETNKEFILGIASPDCEHWESVEILLDQVLKLFVTEELAYKSSIMPIVRLDSSKYRHMIKPFEIAYKGGSKIYLFSKGKYYAYEKGMHLNLFLHFLNRHLYPVVVLKSIQDIESFRNTHQEWIENTPFYNGVYKRLDDIFPKMDKITRVIAFISDKSEHKSDLKYLQASAKHLAYRDDLRVGKIIDPSIVKHYKHKMGEKWFDKDSLNSIVVFTKDKSDQDMLNYYSLAMDDLDMKFWINAASLGFIDKITELSLQIMEPMYMPIFIAFINKTHPNYGYDSILMMETLARVILNYPQFLFGYWDDSFLDFKKKDMGVTTDKLPVLALYNGPQNTHVIFPSDWEITKNNIDFFLQHGIKAATESKSLNECN